MGAAVRAALQFQIQEICMGFRAVAMMPFHPAGIGFQCFGSIPDLEPIFCVLTAGVFLILWRLCRCDRLGRRLCFLSKIWRCL